jgi:hypothetical protein
MFLASKAFFELYNYLNTSKLKELVEGTDVYPNKAYFRARGNVNE